MTSQEKVCASYHHGTHFKMATSTYNTEEVLNLLDFDDSYFSDSESSGEEGEEVYPYSGPNFRADNSEEENEESSSSDPSS